MEAAKKAMEKVNDKELKGNKLVVQVKKYIIFVFLTSFLELPCHSTLLINILLLNPGFLPSQEKGREFCFSFQSRGIEIKVRESFLEQQFLKKYQH